MRPLAPLALMTLAWIAASSAAAHEGHVDEAPWNACLERSLDDRCAWVTGEHQSAHGTCRRIGGGLLCVRSVSFERGRPASGPIAALPAPGLPTEGSTPLTIGVVVGAASFLLLVQRRWGTAAHSRVGI
jgi:hypothetical protein